MQSAWLSACGFLEYSVLSHHSVNKEQELCNEFKFHQLLVMDLVEHYSRGLFLVKVFSVMKWSFQLVALGIFQIIFATATAPPHIWGPSCIRWLVATGSPHPPPM